MTSAAAGSYGHPTIQSGRETWLVDAAATTPAGKVLPPGPMEERMSAAAEHAPGGGDAHVAVRRLYARWHVDLMRCTSAICPA